MQEKALQVDRRKESWWERIVRTHRHRKIARAEFKRYDVVMGPPSRLEFWLRIACFLTPFGVKVFFSRDGSSPYLLRVYLTPKFVKPSRYLHYFFRSDEDPAHHNHPWEWGESRVLTEGYVEERLDPTCGHTTVHIRSVGDRFMLYAHTFHKVILRPSFCGPLRRPWTFFTSGPRTGNGDEDEWGFMDRSDLKYIPWGPYINKVRHEVKLDITLVDEAVDDPEEARTERFIRSTL